MSILVLKEEFFHLGETEVLYSRGQIEEQVNKSEISHYRKAPLIREGSIIKIVSVKPRHFNDLMVDLLGKTREVQSFNQSSTGILNDMFYIKGEHWNYKPSCIAEVIKY